MSNDLQADSIRLGWALIHSLWQGLVVALALEILLGFVGRKSASLRYLFCGLALAVMPVSLMGTYIYLGPESQVAPAQPRSNELAAAGAGSVHGVVSVGLDPSAIFTLTDVSSRKTAAVDLDALMPWIVTGWLLGILVLTGRKAGGFVILSRLRRRGVAAPDESLSELFQQACGKIGIDPRSVCLKISNLVSVPMTMGWIRPVVLFPAVLLTGLSTGEIELLLAHELAHIRRRDYLVNLLQTVVETLFFYHPVIWRISRLMRQERENCCDDLVASQSTEALAYAKVLLQLETLRPNGTALASAGNGGSLLERIQRLIGEPAPASTMGVPVLLVLLSVLGAVTAASVVAAQQQAPSDKPPLTMTAAEAQSRGVAALVNGHPILWSDVDAQDAEAEKQARDFYSGSDLNRRIADSRQTVLQTLIFRQLIIDDFKAQGGSIPEESINERINDIVKDDFGGDRAAFLKALPARGTTFEKYKEDIEDNAIVNYQRSKNVADKVWQYYQDHLDAFPQDEQINVTLITIKCDTSAQNMADHAHNPKYAEAQQVLEQVKNGADASALAKKYPARFAHSTMWITESGEASLNVPAIWQAVEKLQPGQTSGIIDGDWYYGIAKVNDRRPARVASTAETAKQKQALIDALSIRMSQVWRDELRSKAQVQTFAATDAAGTASIIKVADVSADGTATTSAPVTPPVALDAIPVAQPVPVAPEPAFAQPVTVKETRNGSTGVTRLYYQGGNLILQQEINETIGGMGQFVFYKGAIVVDDRRGTRPIPFSSRSVAPNNSRIQVQSVAADSVSPESLRLLDADHEIITEFFIDKNGLMRPITKAEHDADIARREAAFSNMPPVNPAASRPQNDPGASTDDSFIARPDDESGRAMIRKLKSIVIDKVNFNNIDVAAALQFFAQKSRELDPDKKGFDFVLGDLSQVKPGEHVHRGFTVVLENVPLDELLGYLCSQTNLKCSIENNTVYFKPPSPTHATAAPAPSDHGNVTIIKASYEARDGSGAKDVTDSVAGMLKDNHLQVTVGNSVFGGDPAYLHTKQLRVEYLENGQKQVAVADEGMTLTIPPQANGPVATPGGQVTNTLAGNFGQLFNQMGTMMTNEANVMAQQMSSAIPPVQTNAPSIAQQADDPFALPAPGTFGQLGRVMEIHVTSSRRIAPGVRAVHYYSQYRDLPAGAEAGVTWGGEIAVYGLPSSMTDGDSWKGLVYPAGHMTFGADSFSVYATTKDEAIVLAQNETGDAASRLGHDEPDLATLRKDLLTAKQDADARRVMLNGVKDLPDDKFLAVMAGLGRSESETESLRKEIAEKNADVDSLLKGGLTENHPRVQGLRAEIASLQKQLDPLVAGIRQAMAIDGQMADSRVALLQKEVDRLTLQASSPPGTNK